MHSIRALGLITILLIVACGQPADLPSAALAPEAPSATSETASTAPQTMVADIQPVPCPTFPAYPPPAPGETPTPTNTPPPPTPTVDPEAVPTGTAPGGLGTITLPEDDATLRGIFAALPEKIGEYQRVELNHQESDFIYVWYQDSPLDPAIPDSRLEIFANGMLYQQPAPPDQEPYEEPLFPGRIVAPYSDYWRRDGQLFYGYYDRHSFAPLDDQYQNCREARSVSLTFLEPNRSWLFHAEAPTREDIELLLAAFVQTVNASPAPIPYMTPTPWPTMITREGYPVPGSYLPPQEDMLQQMPTATPTTTPIP